MYKLIVFILCLLVIPGCASHQRFYEGKPLPDNEVATISGSGISGIGGFGYSYIQVTEINNKIVKLHNLIPNSVDLLPGKYQIKIHYYNVKFNALAEFELDANPGEKYFINFNKENINHFSIMSLENIWLENAFTKKVIQKIENWSNINVNIFIQEPIYIRI